MIALNKSIEFILFSKLAFMQEFNYIHMVFLFFGVKGKQRMEKYFYCLVTMCLLLSPTFATAATLDNLDQSNLISAIDDYRFSDYDIAIQKLELLHQKTPNNPDVLQYLALSHDESASPDKAIPYFEAWFKTNNYNTSIETKFAWLGLANAYMKTNQPDKAIATMRRWLNANPSDMQSKITMGDMLIRQNKHQETAILLSQVLESPASTADQKAAAWYYKAYLAYLNNDVQNTEVFAQKSLDTDGEGAYASAAQRLKDSPSQQQLGFNGYASLEAFYSSNVKLAPEQLFAADADGDSGLQSTLVLGWAFPKVSVNYVLSATKHQTLNTYDLVAHILSASWKKDATWRFKPSYEYIILDTDNLYQSFGLGIYNTRGDWTYQYTVKFKQFNNAYGDNNVDLERLGGSSHYFAAKTDVARQGYKISLSPYLIAELTNGDATHDNSDSYYQLGGNVSASIPIAKGWETQLKLDIYSRFYAAADTNILLDATDNTKRQDTYFKVATSTSWKPWKAYNVSLVFNASYLSNTSNYDDSLVAANVSKAYSGWRIGSMVSGQW